MPNDPVVNIGAMIAAALDDDQDAVDNIIHNSVGDRDDACFHIKLLVTMLVRTARPGLTADGVINAVFGTGDDSRG